MKAGEKQGSREEESRLAAAEETLNRKVNMGQPKMFLVDGIDLHPYSYANANANEIFPLHMLMQTCFSN